MPTPTFQAYGRKITVTVPQHTLKIHYNITGFNSRSKLRFSNVSYSVGCCVISCQFFVKVNYCLILHIQDVKA